MTWHRADGGHPTDDGPEADARDPVTESPLGLARALVHGGVTIALGAGVAAAIVLVGTIVVGLLAEELLGARAIDLLARGAVVSVFVLALIAALGEPLRRALQRRLLLRDAGRLPAGATPPSSERSALRQGPHGTLLALGVTAIVIGAICLPVGIMLATDDREAALARILVPTVSAILLLGGILLTMWNRKRGPGRTRWEGRYRRLSSAWGRAVRPVPRAHTQRRHIVLNAASSAVGVGAMVFFAGVFVRQPGRYADPIEWDEPGERLIDGLLSTGALVMASALAVVLSVHAALLIWTAVRDRRAVRALRRGERVLLERVDAVLLDPAPLERVAMVLGVLGWIAVSYGWSPTFIAGIESQEATADIQPLTALVMPGLLILALSWVLGAIGAARLRARRVEVHGLLARDPRPWEHAERGPVDRRADAIRDVALIAPGALQP